MNHDELTGRWPHDLLPSNVVVGSDCYLERLESFERFRSRKDPGLILGDRVWVYTWTTFNVEPTGRLVVGDDTTLVGAVFMCAAEISIGKRCTVSYNVTIADSDFHPRDPRLRREDSVANAPGATAPRPPIETRPVVIGDDVTIGIGAIILKGVTIGDRAVVDAGCVVARDVPADTCATGNPATLEKR